MAKSPILPEDLDQYERDLYDQESGNAARGCLNAFKLLGILVIVFLLALWLLGCKAAEPPVALPYGPVISVQGDQIEVAFEVINKEPGSQISGWFYVPGHAFVKGNIFPDFSKYRHPLPAAHGNR